jgi:hypothetical protein
MPSGNPGRQSQPRCPTTPLSPPYSFIPSPIICAQFFRSAVATSTNSNTKFRHFQIEFRVTKVIFCHLSCHQVSQGADFLPTRFEKYLASFFFADLGNCRHGIGSKSWTSFKMTRSVSSPLGRLFSMESCSIFS